MERYGVGSAASSGGGAKREGESFGAVGSRGRRGRGSNPNFRWPGSTLRDGLEEREELKFKRRGPVHTPAKLPERTQVVIPSPSDLESVAVIAHAATAVNEKESDSLPSSSSASGVGEKKVLEKTTNTVQVSRVSGGGAKPEGDEGEGVKTREGGSSSPSGISTCVPEEKSVVKSKGKKRAAPASPPPCPPGSSEINLKAVAATAPEEPKAGPAPALLEKSMEQIKLERVAGGASRVKRGGENSVTYMVPAHFRPPGMSIPATPEVIPVFNRDGKLSLPLGYSPKFCSEGTHFYTHPSQTKFPIKPGPAFERPEKEAKTVEEVYAQMYENDDEYPIGGNPNVVVIREPSTLRFLDY